MNNRKRRYAIILSILLTITLFMPTAFAAEREDVNPIVNVLVATPSTVEQKNT